MVLAIALSRRRDERIVEVASSSILDHFPILIVNDYSYID
jgi:hypothetical protein